MVVSLCGLLHGGLGGGQRPAADGEGETGDGEPDYQIR